MRKILFIVSLILITNYAVAQTDSKTISYDKDKKQTAVIIAKYGTIVLPEKWIETSFNKTSQQHFLQSINATTIGVTKNPREQYPFFTTKQTDKEFVSEFVKWDSEYLIKQGLGVHVLSDQSGMGYILWQSISTIKEEEKKIFLFGSKNGLAYNFSGVSGENWSDEQIVIFLINLFNNN